MFKKKKERENVFLIFNLSIFGCLSKYKNFPSPTNNITFIEKQGLIAKTDGTYLINGKHVQTRLGVRACLLTG